MNNQKLVENIRNICRKKRLSISELERELGFSPGLISRWVRMSPSLDKVVMVAQYLGVSLDEMIGNAEEENEESFATLLRKMTEDENSGVQWNDLNEHNCGNAYVRELLENRNDGKCKAYVCHYESGYFLVIKDSAQDEKGEVGLYIIPEIGCFPVKETADAGELEALGDVVEEWCQERQSEEKAKELKEKFMSEFGNFKIKR